LLTLQQALKHLTDILDDMKSISNLDRIWRTACCTIGIIAGAIACDDRDTRMRFQPVCKRVCSAIGEHIDRSMALKINEQRAVGLALAESEVVHPENLGCRVREGGSTAGKP
jgi:hypothetical protein